MMYIRLLGLMVSTGLCAQEPVDLWSNDAESLTTPRAHQVEMSVGKDGVRFEAPGNGEWPGVFFDFEESRAFSPDSEVQVTVRNMGDHPAWLGVRVDNPGADGAAGSVAGYGSVPPGGKGVLRVPFRQTGWFMKAPPDLISMRHGPKPLPDFDPGSVVGVYVFLTQPAHPSEVVIERLRLKPEDSANRVIETESFFPFVDRFGQMMHGDWPGKLETEEAFIQRREVEEAAVEARPAPLSFNRWGGWADGPQLEATGSFYVTRHEGKWTLVDPEGRLFWSHGLTCVTPWAHTPIRDRRDYFAWLPERRGPWGEHFNYLWWTTPKSEYYGGPMPLEGFSFYSANLQRKYGAEWFDHFPELVENRFRHWGLNTLGNWTDAEVYRQANLPYTVAVHYSTPRIPGTRGMWYAFPDPFDKRFRQGLEERLKEVTRDTANDPYCLGYFVDNEMAFGDPGDLAFGVLRSPADTEAKQAFLRVLKNTYGDVDAFHSTWGIDSWDGFLEKTDWEREEIPEEDLLSFNRDIQRRYFRTVRQLVKRHAPRKLYLGCRFHKWNDEVIRLAAEEMDVISFNLYRDSVEGFSLPEGVEAPVLSGEFHFGSLDRGLFSKGLGSGAADQQDGAEKYKAYVRSALDHPNVVGVHHFQYADQPLTGRFDGENFQVGFVDVADTPYPEITEAAREMGEEMYERRFEGE